MGPHSLNDLIYSGPKASYLGPFLLSLVVEPTMALYTGSDILANRGSPHFGAESPDGRLGPLMAPAKMAMAGNWQWQEQEAGREGQFLPQIKIP